jgi:hypothetical protein
MKKTVRTLVGTAVLFSLLSSYSVAQERLAQEPSPALDKSKKGRKAYFREVEKREKNELEDHMAKTLSSITGLKETEVKNFFLEGKTAREIILLSGKDERIVEKMLADMHKQKMKEKLTEQVLAGSITKERALEIERKLGSKA